MAQSNKTELTHNISKNNTSIPATSVPSPYCILLWSSSSACSDSVKSAQRSIEKALLSKHIKLQKVDGASKQQRPFRNQLFGISRKRGKYPQIFIKDESNEITFVGTDGDINFLMESGNFDQVFRNCFDDNLITNNSKHVDPKEEALHFKKLAEDWWSAKNLFKAQKFARKSLRLDDNVEVRELLDKIRAAQQQSGHGIAMNFEAHLEIHDGTENEGEDAKNDDIPMVQSIHNNKEKKPVIKQHDTRPQTPRGNDDLINQILEQSTALQAKNKKLEDENHRLRQQLAAVQTKEEKKEQIKQKKEIKGTCYQCDIVGKFASKQRSDIRIRSEVKSSHNESHKKMDVHDKRLKEWSQHTVFLEEQFLKHNQVKLVIDDMNTNDAECGNNNDEKKPVIKQQETKPPPPRDNDGDDEKQEKVEKMDVSTLYLSYKDCMKLLQEQRQRTEEVMMHCMNLNEETNSLRSIIKIYDNDVPSTKHKYDGLCQQYDDIQQKRQHLQEKVRNMVNEINTLIQEENKTNQEKCITLDRFNLLRMELDRYQKILSISRDLTNQYAEFEGNVEQKTDDLQKYFASKWDEHERKWIEWDIDGIMYWLKYLIHDKILILSKDFNLDIVRQKMNENKIIGSSLHKLERNELSSLGITCFDDRVQIYKEIRVLIEKYPGPIKEVMFSFSTQETMGDQKEGKMVQIPTEYLCPISNEIMHDPVVAYDNKTYERCNIVEYIAKNKRAPNCEHECDGKEPLFKNRELKTKIDEFLRANPNVIHHDNEAK